VWQLREIDALPLPPQIRLHSKILFRAKAEKYGLPIGRANLIAATQANIPAALGVGEWPDAAGTSVVLLYPVRVDNKVVREFTRNGDEDVEFYVRECRRYAIRRYPSTVGVVETARDMLKIGLRDYAFAAVLVQEVVDGRWTGIARMTADGVFLEIAEGHFIPKGTVAASQYIFNSDGKLIYSRQDEQTQLYRFRNGYVVYEDAAECSPPSDSILASVAALLGPFLANYPDTAIEFGVVDSTEKAEVYVIDEAEAEADSTALTLRFIQSGIVSPGFALGRPLTIDTAGRGVLDIHLCDDRGSDQLLRGQLIFAEYASIELTALANRMTPGCGFVFANASVLCHLGVVLRERGIPAIRMEEQEFHRLKDMSTVMRLVADPADPARCGVFPEVT
jgi:hypothetical protein